MKLIKSETEISYKPFDGQMTIDILIENEIHALIDVYFEWEWNREETERVVTKHWIKKDGVNIFDDGTEIKLPSWRIFEIALFFYREVKEEYINELINEQS